MKTKYIFALAIAAAFTTVLASPAFAHVTVNPKTVDAGSYAKLAFRVPNEKPDAATTKVEVHIPTETPITTVSVQPHSGWNYAIEKAKLKTPIDSHGRQIDEVVSKITWTANEGVEIKPGEFEEFNISAGPLPTNTNSIEFKALQTYSNGEIVRWIESPIVGQPEPQRPAPKLALNATTTTSVTATPSAGAGLQATENNSDNSSAIAIAALILAIVSIGFTIISNRFRKARSEP